MVSARKFAECALLPKWETFSYSSLDCQGFVEAVLKDIGIRKPDGSVYNWKGSNSMYRTFYSWRGTKEEAIKKYGDVPIGAFVYVWDPTGEQEKGYTDGRGNAKHVGIYCGNNTVRDSTRYRNAAGDYVRNGPGTTTLKSYNRVTLFVGLDYNQNNNYSSSVEECMSIIDRIRKELIELEGKIYDIK